jgi:hypothetical protein
VRPFRGFTFLETWGHGKDPLSVARVQEEITAVSQGHGIHSDGSLFEVSRDLDTSNILRCISLGLCRER